MTFGRTFLAMWSVFLLFLLSICWFNIPFAYVNSQWCFRFSWKCWEILFDKNFHRSFFEFYVYHRRWYGES